MHFATIFSIVATFFSAAQALSAKQCTKELASIVYAPHFPQADYLTRISKQLVAQTPLLFTNQAAQVFLNFANQFQVTLFVGDAFGNVVQYNADGTTATPSDQSIYTVARGNAQSWLNQPAFNVLDGFAYLTFGIFDADVEYKSIVIKTQTDPFLI
jgi:hypothetical protein